MKTVIFILFAFIFPAASLLHVAGLMPTVIRAVSDFLGLA